MFLLLYYGKEENCMQFSHIRLKSKSIVQINSFINFDLFNLHNIIIIAVNVNIMHVIYRRSNLEPLLNW